MQNTKPPREIFHTPAEKQGLITVEHSIITGEPKYFLLVPHDSSRLAFPDEVKKYLPQDQELLHKTLEIKRDKGTRELALHILKLLPGGMAVMVDVARGVLDMNRTFEHTLGSVVARQLPENIKEMFHTLHTLILQSIEEILATMPAYGKILCLHSMQTNPLAEAKAGLTSDSLKRYIEIREATVGIGPEMKVDIITGPKGEEFLADLHMKNTLGNYFDEAGIPWAENEPFATERNLHKTTDYMLARPGHVLGIDIPKHFLCTGSASDKTFRLVESIPDSIKIEKMAHILAKAFEKGISS